MFEQNDRAQASKAKCTSSKYVELQGKESIVELLLLRGGVWAQRNRLPTTYRPTRDSRFKDLSFFLSLSSSRRHCSRKRGFDLCALVKNKFTAYGWLRSPTSEILFSTLNRIMRGEKEEELSKYANPSISKEYFSLWRIINLYKLQIMKFPIV